MISTFSVPYLSPRWEEAHVMRGMDTMTGAYSVIADLDALQPTIDRELSGIVVAIGAVAGQELFEDVRAIVEVGVVPPENFELFSLKATRRAFAQRDRGQRTDIHLQDALMRAEMNELWRISSASDRDIHVGFAGTWAHHGRQLAAAFATGVSASIHGFFEEARKSPIALDLTRDELKKAQAASIKAADMLIRIQRNLPDSGDNTDHEAETRERFRPILNLINR